MEEKLQKTHNIFSWQALGDIKVGRANLGEKMPVFVYRLLEYSMLDVLVKEYGADKANELFFKAGHLVGMEMAHNVLDLHKPFAEFTADLKKLLEENLVGILEIEEFDFQTQEFILVVKDDLDCSGLKSTDEVVCHYDEGMLAGIFEAYTGKKFMVREVDCWVKGDRVCRFRGWVRKDN